jgi:ABC-2 type transport system permease protein
MSKISLIIKREYLSRVKKKSFIIMTILGPILMSGVGVVPVYMSLQEKQMQKIEVIDDSHMFTYTSSVSGITKSLISQKENIHFDAPPITLAQAQEGFFDTDYDAILWIPPNLLNGAQKGIDLFYKKQLSKSTQSYIEEELSDMIFRFMLVANKVNPNFIKDAKEKAAFSILTTEIDKDGKTKQTNTGLYTAIGLVCAAMIYFFIFFFGVQVMRGVMEEKTSRIVEVILSSVKPFQLMMGKIVGIALVGLTQFLLWVVLTGTLYGIASATILKNVDMKQIQAKEEVVKIGADINVSAMKQNQDKDIVTKLFNDFKSVDVVAILFCFLFYFLAGYLMYAALFAAVGSAVDSEADTQQFMMPITVPLILSFVVAQTVIQDPQGTMAFWFSIIPFTSPIVMMVRLPFGVPAWELLLSMSLLILGFLFTTWIAGRIYRTGILMYGKKVTWKELGKWLFFKG